MSALGLKWRHVGVMASEKRRLNVRLSAKRNARRRRGIGISSQPAALSGGVAKWREKQASKHGIGGSVNNRNREMSNGGIMAKMASICARHRSAAAALAGGIVVMA